MGHPTPVPPTALPPSVKKTFYKTFQKLYKKTFPEKLPDKAQPPLLPLDRFLWSYLARPQPSSVNLSFICSQYILFTCHCPPPTPTFGNTSQRNLEQPRYRKVGKSVFCMVRKKITALITNGINRPSVPGAVLQAPLSIFNE